MLFFISKIASKPWFPTVDLNKLFFISTLIIIKGLNNNIMFA